MQIGWRRQGKNATTAALKAKTQIAKDRSTAEQKEVLIKKGKAGDENKLLDERARAHKNREKLIKDRNIADTKGRVTHEDLQKHYDEIQQLKV